MFLVEAFQREHCLRDRCFEEKEDEKERVRDCLTSSFQRNRFQQHEMHRYTRFHSNCRNRKTNSRSRETEEDPPQRKLWRIVGFQLRPFQLQRSAKARKRPPENRFRLLLAPSFCCKSLVSANKQKEKWSKRNESFELIYLFQNFVYISSSWWIQGRTAKL